MRIKSTRHIRSFQPINFPSFPTKGSGLGSEEVIKSVPTVKPNPSLQLTKGCKFESEQNVKSEVGVHSDLHSVKG